MLVFTLLLKGGVVPDNVSFAVSFRSCGMYLLYDRVSVYPLDWRAVS